MSSAYANVLHQRHNRRNWNLNEPIPIEKEIQHEYEESKESFEQAMKNKATRVLQIRILKKSLKRNDTIAAILSMIGLVFAVFEYDDYFGDGSKPHFQSTSFGNILRSFVSLSTMILLVFLWEHSRTSYKINRIKYPATSQASYWESKYFKYYLIEALINLIHTPPGLDINFRITQLNFQFDYSLSTITVSWMLLRFYLVFRLFAFYSKWTGQIAESCCGAEGCEANTIFAIKSVLKDKPYETLSIIMIASTVIFGLAIRNFERPLYYGKENEPYFQDYSYIWNGMWLIAVTMTTVGYGDYYPRTHLGRFVAVLACFWGVFLVSMMVVTLTVSSSFETKEAKAFDILYRLNLKKDIKDKAAQVGKLVLELAALNKQPNSQFGQGKGDFAKKVSLRNQLTVKLEEFKNARALLMDYDISPEEMLRQLTEKIDRDFEEIKEIATSITMIEAQVEELDKAQQAVMGALHESMLFTTYLQNNLIKYKNISSSSPFQVMSEESQY